MVWEPMDTAPKDRIILIYAASKYDLPPFFAPAKWHPDADFCVDELREATYWTELPLGYDLRFYNFDY